MKNRNDPKKSLLDVNIEDDNNFIKPLKGMTNK